jgi:hypothetical protein
MLTSNHNRDVVGKTFRDVRENIQWGWSPYTCLFEFISYGTLFFSHYKTILVGLSAVKPSVYTAVTYHVFDDFVSTRRESARLS